jgi:hypothetical protein
MGESCGVFAFIVSENRVPVERLLESPQDLFAPGIFDKLPSDAQEDFRQAGRGHRV